MRKKWKQCILILAGIFFICLLGSPSVPAQAATAKQYKKYVQKNLIPKYGKAKTGVYHKTTGDYQEDWCTRKGVLSVYTTDFNNDGKKRIPT